MSKGKYGKTKREDSVRQAQPCRNDRGRKGHVLSRMNVMCDMTKRKVLSCGMRRVVYQTFFRTEICLEGFVDVIEE